MLKRVITLVLTLVLLVGVCLPAVEGHAAGATLAKKDGVWYYMENGKVINTTTLVKFNGSWWYVVNGKVASNTTTLVKFNGSWWYVVKGKIASNTTTLVKFNGSWWYVVKGKVASSTTTLVKFNNEWWYIVKGKVASNTTSLVKFNNEWWYIVKGKVASNTTSLVKFNNEWWYVVKGKLASNTTTLFKYNEKWYYVNQGKVDTYSNVLCRCWGEWYYVDQGDVHTKPSYVRTIQDVAYTYNDSGKIIYGDGDNYLVTYHYNQQEQLTNIKYQNDTEEIGEECYTYYSDGSYRVDVYTLTSIGYYLFDKNDNITYSQSSNASFRIEETYHYDDAGYISDVTSQIFDGGEVPFAESQYVYKYEFDRKGRPTGYTVYENGNLFSTVYYAYNTKGELMQEITLQGGSNIGTLDTYGYTSTGKLWSHVKSYLELK